MPGVGAPPNPNRRRRNADTYADVQRTVNPDNRVRGPGLMGDYSPQTKQWHETWRRAPQAQAFQVTDWQRLAMLAPLVDAYWARPSASLLGEIRLSESLLGATFADRLRARIKVEDGKPAEPRSAAGVASLEERRRRVVAE